MANENLGDLRTLGGMIPTPIGDFIITEKGTLRRMLEIAPIFLTSTPKDVQSIQINSLNSIVDPHDEVELILGKRLTNPVILSFDFGCHIVTHQNYDLPIPVNFIHIGVTRFNLGLVGTVCDLLPGNLGKIGLFEILHCGVIRVARDQNSQLLGMVGEFHPLAKIGQKLKSAFPRGTLQKDSHYSFRRHIA
jgi:hypothetical protein